MAFLEGWVLPERWRGTSVNMRTCEDADTEVAQVVSAWREADHSVVDFQWLVARRGKPIQHYSEIWRSPLVRAQEMLASFRRAGFRAKVLRAGRYRDRGLYVGIRPASR